jgi:1,4-dihydroxy-2-naphthoate octaprenyltransferase
VAAEAGHPVWWRGVLALIVAVALQVGTNYANDYSDGVRGTDDARVGPVRLVASGLAAPAAVKRAAFLSFGLAGLAGLALAGVVGWWLILVGAACIAAGWFYTGGPKPYGYAGLGELFVFVFFGLVATAGTTYVELARLPGLAVVAAVPVGLLAVALLVVNNLRDIPGDAVAGKRTLAVRVGAPTTRVLYAGAVVSAFVLTAAIAVARPWALVALGAVPLSVPPLRRVMSGAAGPELVPVLVDTGRLQLVFGVLLAAGIWV